MRIALAQIDPTVGDLPGNAERILSFARRAAAEGASWVIFPELALVGYPPLDLLDEPEFVGAALRAREDLVERLGRELPALLVIFGAVGPSDSRIGKRLRNVAVVARGGREIAACAKSLLPSYDVFDEDRWFEPGTAAAPVDVDGTRLGLSVCEDIWNDDLYWRHRLYPRDPVAELVAAGAGIVVNISASPYHRGKCAAREEMLRAAARRHGRCVAFVNQAAANDELLFDGTSCVIDEAGRTVARARSFAEDLIVLDMPAPGAQLPECGPPPGGDARELRQALAFGVGDYVRKCGFTSVLLGLSGGIDSAVVAALAVQALGPDRVEGVLMPSRFTSERSNADALDLAARLGMRTRTIPIEPAHAALLAMLAPHFEGRAPDVTEENVQARVRGILLMALSNKLGSLLLTTGNKSELAVGYCTLYGDMTGGLAVIGDCRKGWVNAMAADFNVEREIIPRSILDRPPTAELRPDQRDEDDLPPYALLDAILEGLVERRETCADLEAQGLPGDVIRRVRRMLERNEYKRRQAPPILRVTQRAFGAGRRLPIARG
jgi:NAD+ synthase/NAD+ synthase (glutamine-hydrolysing)